MPALPPTTPPNAAIRILLWFVALFLGALVFSAWLGHGLPNLSIVRITLVFALPAWLFYLPLVVACPGTTRRQLGILVIAGFLIGPATIAVWSAILPSHGRTDPEALGLRGMMISAAIVGVATTVIYLVGLRLLQKKSA